MNGEDKLFRGDLSDAEIKSLSREELALWVMRPTQSVVAEARAWMKVRVALLIMATIYYAYAYRMSAEQSPILFFLFCYEFAYYNLRKEKAILEDVQARVRYHERVQELRRNQPA
jgi:phage gp36-like protein